MATFYVRFRSCFLLLARFFVIFSVFLIYFYCFLMITICFPTDFMTFILKNPRNSMTSAKRSNVQSKPNQPCQHILLYTECQSSFIPVSYWLRTYHVIVEKFYCLSSNVAKRWTLLLFAGKQQIHRASRSRVR